MFLRVFGQGLISQDNMLWDRIKVKVYCRSFWSPIWFRVSCFATNSICSLSRFVQGQMVSGWILQHLTLQGVTMISMHKTYQTLLPRRYCGIHQLLSRRHFKACQRLWQLTQQNGLKFWRSRIIEKSIDTLQKCLVDELTKLQQSHLSTSLFFLFQFNIHVSNSHCTSWRMFETERSQ